MPKILIGLTNVLDLASPANNHRWSQSKLADGLWINLVGTLKGNYANPNNIASQVSGTRCYLPIKVDPDQAQAEIILPSGSNRPSSVNHFVTMRSAKPSLTPYLLMVDWLAYRTARLAAGDSLSEIVDSVIAMKDSLRAGSAIWPKWKMSIVVHGSWFANGINADYQRLIDAFDGVHTESSPWRLSKIGLPNSKSGYLNLIQGTAGKIRTWLANVGVPNNSSVSQQTSSGYLLSLKQATVWMEQNNALPENIAVVNYTDGGQTNPLLEGVPEKGVFYKNTVTGAAAWLINRVK